MATDSCADAVILEIAQAFETGGHLDYGEGISMREHMLQTACLAERAGADDNLIVAALLHDYGHLVCNMPNNTFEEGEDNYHEMLGANALSEWLDAGIVNAVRLHVDAKRYLCGASPRYVDKLSEASKITLAVQGGAMTNAGMREFERQAGYKLALQVRVFDDLGKQPEMELPELDYYFPYIRRCLT